jgi:glycosyltransferase 2 family protein
LVPTATITDRAITTAPPVQRSARPIWAWARLLGGLAILALLVWRVGTGPFLRGLRAVDAPALAAAFAIGMVTTLCSAWRWRLVAGGLGVRLPLPEAMGAYYRSQFLNTTLPGGVVGDVHRAVRHGADIGDVGLSVRAVVLERFAGQVVQIAIAVVLLAVVPSPVQRFMPLVAFAALTVAAVGYLTARTWARSGSGRWARVLRTGGSVIRNGVFARRNWVGIGIASTIVVAGHLATFVLAARTAGAAAPMTRLLPLGLLALLAMAVPLNFAGWGPREGVTAWAFGAAGLTATLGVSTAVTYGVLVLVASLPGAAVLVARWLQRMPQGGLHG